MYSTIELTKEGRLARLKLNRPAAMNAMDDVMMKELADAFEALKSDTEAQVLIIQGEGKIFSAGGDIKKMVDPESPMDIGKIMVDVSRLAKALYELPQITIAAIHGASAGLGFSMALGCDVILAEENSKLAMNFIGIGLIPDGAGHFFLKERIGVPLAKQLIWAGEVLNGQAAKEKGLVDQIVPDGAVGQAAEGLAAKFLSAPIAAMLASKKILHEQKIGELENVLRMESEQQVAMRQTEDHLEGIKAFVEKRKPEFAGK
ncbi:enoyl-CoA hydratase [Sporosarcina thermotolerans]|uniref:Enoyl-CoA hydratase n=1 Tax=Sporosarcina thermotolerans TaxID=633404 RepID=A0AAW9ABE9_9BACL|nr:enoyl-CoA hydratase [Sporosarcina thermotolerans]MDW0118374.1 enoyl-CoA hydratase [Sporosarcina thermotolerans]WHT49427.1 enoyl-CoA hydratase [Sporosarcina thermotolerans]